MRDKTSVSTEITFPATSFLQDPFIKEGQDPIMDDNGVINFYSCKRHSQISTTLINGSSLISGRARCASMWYLYFLTKFLHPILYCLQIALIFGLQTSE